MDDDIFGKRRDRITMRKREYLPNVFLRAILGIVTYLFNFRFYKTMFQ